MTFCIFYFNLDNDYLRNALIYFRQNNYSSAADISDRTRRRSRHRHGNHQQQSHQITATGAYENTRQFLININFFDQFRGTIQTTHATIFCLNLNLKYNIVFKQSLIILLPYNTFNLQTKYIANEYKTLRVNIVPISNFMLSIDYCEISILLGPNLR